MNTGSTDTLVNAASRLVDELPEGTSGPDVVRHWLASAKADDAKRGVIWPEMTPEQQSEAGLADVAQGYVHPAVPVEVEHRSGHAVPRIVEPGNTGHPDKFSLARTSQEEVVALVATPGCACGQHAKGRIRHSDHLTPGAIGEESRISGSAHDRAPEHAS